MSLRGDPHNLYNAFMPPTKTDLWEYCSKNQGIQFFKKKESRDSKTILYYTEISEEISSNFLVACLIIVLDR